MKVEMLIRGIFIALACWALWDGITTHQNDARGMIVSGVVAAVFATIATAGLKRAAAESEGNDNG